MLVSRLTRKAGKLFRSGLMNTRIVFYRLVSTTRTGGIKPQLFQPLLAAGRGDIRLDTGVKFGVISSPLFWSGYAYLEARKKTARITIGQATWFNNSIAIICERSTISIGKACVIGQSALIVDSDFHAIQPKDRALGASHQTKSVEIGDHVFLGANVTILKGTQIGSGSTVGAGAIVSGIFPENSLIAGNPARLIRQLDPA